MTVRERDLQEIKNYVGWRFNYTSDQEQRGMPEHWVDMDEAARKGFKDDCDGHALAARYQCRKVGIPSRLVFCLTDKNDWNSGHLVLEVEGWIIDNLSTWVCLRDDLDYKWISCSGFNKGDPWHEITN